MSRNVYICFKMLEKETILKNEHEKEMKELEAMKNAEVDYD